MDGYITITELAKKWNVTVRRIQKLCAEGRIPGATKFGTIWAIPVDVESPKDERVTTGKYINWRMNKKQGDNK